MLFNRKTNLKFRNVERLLFRAVGIDLDAFAEQRPVLKHPILFITSLLIYIPYVISMICYMLRYYGDIEKVIESLLLVTQCFLSLFKILSFLWHGKRFVLLIKEIDDLAEEANEEDSQIWHEGNITEQWLANAYDLVCTSTGLVYTLTPLIISLMTYIKTDSVLLLFPCNGIYPYDQHQPLNFVFTYTWIYFAIRFAIKYSSSVDCLFGWFVFGISAHFHILRMKFKRLASELQEYDMRDFQQKLAEALDYHNRVLNLVKKFDAIFSPILFFEVSLECFILCFAYIQIIYDELSKAASPLIFLVTMIFQLMIYCFGGQKIQNESEILYYDIYLKFPWHKMTPKQQRLLIMPLIQTQKSAVITGFFFVVDSDLLVWIFKTAGSFAALLRAVDNN